MICTDTDHYVNTLSTIKKEKKKKLRCPIREGVEQKQPLADILQNRCS